MTLALPYCGAPPAPGLLWERWNLDPVLIGALAIFGLIYAHYSRRLQRSEARRVFLCGWVLTVSALISPLCALSVSLFAARVGQHLALTMIAAPLVALGWPALHVRRHGVLAALERAPLSASGVFAALLWFWHSPAPYAATFSSVTIYWTMHITLIAAALWLWSTLFARRAAFTAIAAAFFTCIQMSLLGAVLTLAPRAMFWPHAFTTAAWGFTPLEDQQLGGVLMWVVGGGVFFAFSLWTLRNALRQRRWYIEDQGAPAQ